MEKLKIYGGKPLKGEVTICGAKNAAICILPALLLIDGSCKIENLPDISDVKLMVEILSLLGSADVETQRTRSYQLWNDCYQDSNKSQCILTSSIWLDKSTSYRHRQYSCSLRAGRARRTHRFVVCGSARAWNFGIAGVEQPRAARRAV